MDHNDAHQLSMIQMLRDFCGRIRWWLSEKVGLPGRTNHELMYQLDRLPSLSTPIAFFKFPWGKIEYVASSNLRAQFNEIFIRRQYSFSVATDAPVIVDCGGNIGMSVIWFKQTFPKSKVTVYEADPDMTLRLSRNLRAVGISDVQVENAAVWNEDGLVAFENLGDDRGFVRSNGKINVRSVDIARCLPSHVDLLKLDVEGAEYVVVDRLCRSGAISRVQNLVAEFHVKRADTDAFIQSFQQLRACGMQVAMTAAVGTWLGQAECPSPFEIIERNQTLVEVFAWR